MDKNKTCLAFKIDGKRCNYKISNENEKTCNIKSHIGQFLEKTPEKNARTMCIARKEKEEEEEKEEGGDDFKNQEGERKENLKTYGKKKKEILKNSNEIEMKIMKRYEKGPSITDEPGFIYIFKRNHEDFKDLFKIGRTKRLPERRMKEWGDAILVESFQVTKNKMAERVIHLRLDYARKKMKSPMNSEKLEIEWFKESLLEIKKIIKDEIREINVKYPK